MPRVDPFARYAVKYFARPLDPIADDNTINAFASDPQWAYNTAVQPAANKMFGAGKRFMEQNFQDVYNKYQAQEGLNTAAGQPQTGSFYDYVRNFDFGRDYRSMRPEERGGDRPFFAGSRFVRSY